MPSLDTGLSSLNAIISGDGIKLGKVYELFGEESVAKSTIAQYFMIKFKEQYTDGEALYIDTENSFDELRYNYMGGSSNISVLSSIVVEPTLARIFDVLNRSKLSGNPAFIVWDTVAFSVLESDIANGANSGGIAAKPRLLNAVLPKILELLKETDSVLLLLNQVYSNIGKFGGVKTKGGRGIRYSAAVRFQVRRVKDYAKVINGIQVVDAIGVEIKTVKNKLFYPRLKTFLYIHNELGIDIYGSYIEYLKQAKLVSSAGAWSRLKFDDKVDIKFNNATSLKKAIDKTPLVIDVINYLVYASFASISPLTKIKLLSKLNELETKVGRPITKLTKDELKLIPKAVKKSKIEKK